MGIHSRSHATWASTVLPVAIISLVPNTPAQPASKNAKTTTIALPPPIAWMAIQAGQKLGKPGPSSKTTQATKDNLPQIDEDRGWTT